MRTLYYWAISACLSYNLQSSLMGQPQNVESYHPIANLCLTSKIFENLILNQILEIQEQNIELQSIILIVLNND
jgi:hypothetical protein